jgi:hypothetical protein
MAVTVDQVTGPIRTIVPVLTAMAVSKGWIPEGDYTTPLILVVTGAMGIWSVWSNRPSKLA